MAENVPGYYVWEVPGKAVTVQLNLELIDRLSSVVMTGFGAIPRRGAEVGGILIGEVLPDKDPASSKPVIRIDDFEPVACSYKRGPSFLLSEADAAAFGEAWEKWKPEPGKQQYAVGHYRSNTRDQATVADEDRELFAKYFPPPGNVMLFVKPHAAKPTVAGFITYENGNLEDSSALEFPFRRYEVEGTVAPARRPLADRERGERSVSRLVRRELPAAAYEADPPASSHASELPASYRTPFPAPDSPHPQLEGERPYAITTESRTARRKGWAWIPLSFIFLLLGVLLGFQAAITIYPKNAGPTVLPGEDPYLMKLSVTKNDDTLHLKWDRDAAAFRMAPRGVLHIKDGDAGKEVELDSTQLQNGSVIYKRLSRNVQFRLEVFPKNQVSVAETIDWKE